MSRPRRSPKKRWGRCAVCHRLMRPGVGCLLTHEEFKDGIRHERVPFGQELAQPPRREWFESDEIFAAVLRIYNDSVALFGTGPGWHYVGDKKVPRTTCSGCGTPVGGYHHVGCDDEVCPLCRLQAGACHHYPGP